MQSIEALGVQGWLANAEFTVGEQLYNGGSVVRDKGRCFSGAELDGRDHAHVWLRLFALPSN